MSTGTKSIAEMAYELWIARGRPHGSAERDWLEAERLAQQSTPAAPETKAAKVDETIAQTFPASDPPATHTPDIVPSNAEAKWAAASRNKAARAKK
jgi:Protein of unknown function (DUF2934)